MDQVVDHQTIEHDDKWRIADAMPSTGSAVSWGAILAGAAGAAALSLILLLLGTGLGLSSVSPWTNAGASAAVIGVSTIVWITLTQLLASGLGGYLAGRLRSRWDGTHIHEVYFRDTAHGFLAWAIATLATATLLASAIGSIAGGAVQAGASVAGGAASTAMSAASGAAAARSGTDAGPMGYFVDTLFRKDEAPGQPAAAGTQAGAQDAGTQTAEVTRIFVNSIRSEALPPADVHYLGQVVAQRTGLPQQAAEQRVTQAFAGLKAKLNQAEAATKDAADKARKTSAYMALWLFISLLIGAFVASWAATFGGRQRDLWPHVQP